MIVPLKLWPYTRDLRGLLEDGEDDGMTNSALTRVSKLLRLVLLAAALFYFLVFVVMAFFRIRYPFALEWLEESIAVHVQRILGGQRIYVSPSLEFVPFAYTPVYYYLSAAVSLATGSVLSALRLVSFVSSLGCFALIFLFVRRETKDAFSAAVAACLFVATFRLSGAWLDIARVDSLFLLLVIASLYLVKHKASATSCIFAGMLFSVAFLTKQTALSLALPMVVYYLCLSRRHALLFLGTCAGAIWLSTLILNRIHEGWYSYYVFGKLSEVPIRKIVLLEFWTADVLGPLAIACSVAILYLFLQLASSRKFDVLFYLLAAGGAVGAAWLSRLNEGGYKNVLFPAYALIAILFGLGMSQILHLIRSDHSQRGRYFEISAYCILLLQFVNLIYNPFLMVPSREDLKAGRQFVEQLAGTAGDILMPYHPYLAALAGKNSYAHAEPMYLILRGRDEKAKEKLIGGWLQAIREKKFEAIVLDMHRSRQMWERGMVTTDFEGYCTEKRPTFESKSAFWPVTGVKIRPEILLYRCSERSSQPQK